MLYGFWKSNFLTKTSRLRVHAPGSFFASIACSQASAVDVPVAHAQSCTVNARRFPVSAFCEETSKNKFPD